MLVKWETYFDGELWCARKIGGRNDNTGQI